MTFVDHRDVCDFAGYTAHGFHGGASAPTIPHQAETHDR
jgi:hypothetical protein